MSGRRCVIVAGDDPVASIHRMLERGELTLAEADALETFLEVLSAGAARIDLEPQEQR